MKHKKFRFFTVFSVIALSLVILLNIGFTYAWFTDSLETTSSSLTFGTVSISANNSSCLTASSSKLKPGDKFLAQNISMNLASNSQPVYIRAKLSVSATGLVSGSDDEKVYNSLASKFADLTTSTGADYAWKYESDGYYYLTNTAKNTPLSATSKTSGYYVFLTVANSELDSSLEYTGQNVKGTSIKVTLDIQAIQSANITASMDSVKTAMNSEYS